MKNLSITRKIISVSLGALFLCTFLLGCSKSSLGTPRVVTYVSDYEKFDYEGNKIGLVRQGYCNLLSRGR